MKNDRQRHLRVNATAAEIRLWSLLRNRRLQSYKFRRQHPIGGFIVDFANTKYRLVIEADGGQHNENPADERRTAALECEGWRVIRFWNNEILENPEGVLIAILEALERRPSPAALCAAPSPAVRERGKADS